MTNQFRSALRTLRSTLRARVSNIVASVAGRLRRPQPAPPPCQLLLDLDELTATGLPLRDALPLKSTEYWLMLGQPHLAEQELQSLPADARRHPWPLRVQLAAHHTHTR